MIPFLDLKKANEPYEAEFKTVFQDFLESGYYILGNQTRLFETNFATFCGVNHCIGVGNGLDALRIILEGYKVLGRLTLGDEVLVASNTFIATILAIQQAGLRAVLVEADTKTYNFDFSDLARKISAKTKAIMPVHLYGQLAPMNFINEFAKDNELRIIEDAAQAHGAKDESGKRAGSLGDAAAFSFYPTKNLGAMGDGGAITTNDKALAKICAKLRNYGTSSKYVNDEVGFNSRLDELQAAFLNVKLPYLEIENQKRRDLAKRYLAEIVNPKVMLPVYDGSENHVFHLFVLRVSDRTSFIEHLLVSDIGTLIHYPIAPHQQKALSNYKQYSFPVSEQIHREVVSIPLSPVLTSEEVTKVIETINSY